MTVSLSHTQGLLGISFAQWGVNIVHVPLSGILPQLTEVACSLMSVMFRPTKLCEFWVYLSYFSDRSQQRASLLGVPAGSNFVSSVGGRGFRPPTRVWGLSAQLGLHKSPPDTLFSQVVPGVSYVRPSHRSLLHLVSQVGLAKNNANRGHLLSCSLFSKMTSPLARYLCHRLLSESPISGVTNTLLMDSGASPPP